MLYLKLNENWVCIHDCGINDNIVSIDRFKGTVATVFDRTKQYPSIWSNCRLSYHVIPLSHYSKNVIRTYYAHEMLKFVVKSAGNFTFFQNWGSQHDRRTNVGRY